MTGKKGRKLLAILLVGAMAVSNVSVQAFAAEPMTDVIEEETTSGELDNDSEDMPEEEVSGENQNLIDNPEQEENTEENPEDGLMTLSAETGTFSNLEELRTFYEANKDNLALANALEFSDGNTIVANANGLILLSCVEGQEASFEGYTIKLNGLSGGGSNLSSQIQGFEQFKFLGLGRTDSPFKGTLMPALTTDTNIAVTLSTPFFNVLDVGANVNGITEFSILTAKESIVAFAEMVVGDSADWSAVTVKVGAYEHRDGETVTVTYPGSCIGTIKAGAEFSLGNISYVSDAIVNTASGNSGLLCNTLESGGKFTVNGVNTSGSIQVTSGDAAAGGLVGIMGAGSSITVNKTTGTITLDDKWTIKGNNAGGLIGEATDATLDLNAEVAGAKVISNVVSGSAGGFMGTYHLTSADAFHTYNGNVQTIKNVTLDATGANSYIGALFGILELSKDFSINGANLQSEAGIPKIDGNYDLQGTTTYGGLVGQVFGTNSQGSLSALYLEGNIGVTSTTNNDITYYGGFVGVIGKPGIDNANPNGAYVSITGQASANCNGEKIIADNHYFGGAVGSMFYHSVLEIAERATFTPSTSNIKYGGGVVGVAGRGSTLRLAGVTNLSALTFTVPAIGQNPGTTTNNRLASGQIVGIQNAAVIYAAKSWVLNRPTNPGETDDIGNYGSVIRLGKNIGKGSDTLGDKGGLSEGLISQDAISHKTVFGSPAALDSGVISISNADQFTLLAIAEQTYGDFGIYPSIAEGHILNGNTVKQILFTANIDLSNTGVSGLQRDFYYNDSYAYKGVLDGDGHTLTLDIGQIYANNGDGAGNGQIHGHSQVGLFSQANATIKNLTVAGTIQVREREIVNTDKTKKSTMAVGGCVALSTGNGSTFENVTTNVNIRCTANGTESFIGGLIGLKKGSNSSLTITDCTGNAVITDETTIGHNVIGGLVGVHSAGGTIDVYGTTLTGSITGGTIADAKYGGLISVIKDSPAEMHLDNMKVNGQKVENTASTSSGGLLGYEWNNSKVYFGDKSSNFTVAVSDNSTLNVKGNANTGGLVYLATGYWQVNALSLNGASIQNKNGSLGLLIHSGRKSGEGLDTQLLYLEETSYDAYHIEASNVTVSSSGAYFDEWVVYTCESAETITDNGNSVISIATEKKILGEERKGFDPADSTSTGYQNRTKNNGTEWSTANPNARYYYDLDDIREKAQSTNGYVDTPGEAVLWSVWRYCEKVPDKSGNVSPSNIQDYFKTSDIAIATFDGKGNKIDLTGYSYYPVNVDAASVEIKNCTLVFANKIIELAEAKTGSGLDPLVRTTVGTSAEHTQHYLMHSGLILKYLNTSTTEPSVTLSVKDITLQGTVGKGPDETGSGAIVCGTVQGSGTGGSHFAKVEMNGIVLDGVKVNSTIESNDYAPLLINKVDSYGGIDAQDISVSTNGYATGEKAATSLIGHVGHENATNISLAFSNGIALSGRVCEIAGAEGTEIAIFSHATLLESFQYSGSSSSGYYHFNEGEACTYGKEINGTVENVETVNEQTISKQLHYFDKTDIPVKDGDIDDFNTSNYLPYVCHTRVTDNELPENTTYHELEVNIVKPNLIDGCGTYDDPYIIEQATQLEMVANYIANIATAGWQINIVTDKEKIRSELDENHTTFTYGNSVWTNGVIEYKKDDVKDYLRNAYYKITENLTMDKFVGLGTATYPFRGVVDGGGNLVTINAKSITSGFINVSYGSVVQNLTITYTGERALSSDQAALNSNTVANESYFGGIIGDVKGGDNLIQNVLVVYDEDFIIEISNHLECVGGFFGIVEGGGVILSDMQQPDGLSDSNINWGSLSENEHAYVSPLVGRVLDGFVINETSSSDGSKVFESKAGMDKNYSIGNISPGTTITMDNDGNVTINSPEELLLFSAIINSGACSAGYSFAYQLVSADDAYKANSGKVRNANYSHIGDLNNISISPDIFIKARQDDAQSPDSTNLPYLVTKYAGVNGDLWTLCASSLSSVTTNRSLELSITADYLDMSVYKNGYRGIGGRYNCTATSNAEKGQFQRNTPVFASINGNNSKIKVCNILYGYSDDNFVATAAGGLVNMFRRKIDTEVTVQNLTVKGCVELHDFSDKSGEDATKNTNASSRNYTASVGGVIGRYFTEETGSTNSTYLKLTNLRAEDLKLYSDGATGGIVGQTGVKNLFPFGNASNQYASGVTYMDCSYYKLEATSCQSTGGIVGAACDNVASYAYGLSNSTNITNKIISDTIETTGSQSKLFVYSSTVDTTGLGGLIGNVGSNVEINNKDETNALLLDQITLADENGRCRTGGAIGFLHHGKTTAYNIIVSNSKLGNEKDDNLGGIVGCWYSNASGGVMDGIVIDHCELKAALSVGAVIGYIDYGTKIIRNITVKQTNVKQVNNDSGRGVALIVGQIRNGGIYGENVLLKGNRIICISNAKKGRIIGRVDNDVPIQLLGVSLQYGNDKDGNSIDVSTQPEQDIGSFPYTDYSKKTNKVIISYDAFLTGIENGSGLAGEPSVPISGIGADYKITGDTANPYTITGSDSVNGIVKREGIAYTYIGSKKNYQNVDIAEVAKLTPGIVSTYNANQDTTIENDFKVVQIDGSAACLKQYLNAATNGAFDTAVARSMVDVNQERYKWNKDTGKFEPVSDAKPTLSYNNGNFYATAEYDNQKDMFTLVSVTFKTNDYTPGQYFTRTYHIPVVVRRMLQVDFMATMVSGTVFHAGEMENYNTHALASVGEDITGYLTFKYNSNLSGQEATYDWQGYMEAGAKLLGYYQKTIDTGSYDLPAGTQITLIDCQQEQRRYYASVPEGTTSKLQLFNGNLTFENSRGDAYQPVSMAELLKISVVEGNAADKKWVRLSDQTGATVVDQDGYYYRLYDENTDGDVTERYKLQVTETKPEENFFVVISVPKAESHMLTLIKSGGVTKGSMTWEGGPPAEIHQLHRYQVDDKYIKVDTNKSSEISFNYLDNYNQELTDRVNEEYIQVNSVDDKVNMQFDLNNKIIFTGGNYEVTDPLYQELRVSLKKTENSRATDVYFPSDATATIDLYAYYETGGEKRYFKVDQDGKLQPASGETAAVSYNWTAGNDGNMILPFAVKTNDQYQYVDLSPIRQEAKDIGVFYLEAKVDDLSISTNSVIQNDLIPAREEGSLDHTKMYFTSALSFKENGLSYSTLRASSAGKKGYYLAEKRQAVLKLDYLNADQLGINVSDTHSGDINTTLTLDFSGAEGFNPNLSRFATLNNADKVVFEFSLQQKGKDNLSSTEYGAVSIADYLTGSSITGGDSIGSFRLEVNRNGDGSYPFYNETAGVFSIPITFKVNTTDISQYANYRIYASAALYKGSEPQGMTVNAEKAFITYTLAKINVNGIWTNGGTTP